MKIMAYQIERTSEKALDWSNILKKWYSNWHQIVIYNIFNTIYSEVIG